MSVGVVGWLNELIQVRHLEWCQAHRKQSVNMKSYWPYLLNIIYFHTFSEFPKTCYECEFLVFSHCSFLPHHRKTACFEWWFSYSDVGYIHLGVIPGFFLNLILLGFLWHGSGWNLYWHERIFWTGLWCSLQIFVHFLFTALMSSYNTHAKGILINLVLSITHCLF